jgi:formylmethanofuran dehydrogenase subunit E
MTEAKGYPECWILGCTSPASKKCERCNNDVCSHHFVMSGDDDLCTYCAKMKRRG